MDPRLEASLIAHRVVLAYLVHITGARHSQSPGGIPALAETMLATSLVRLIAAHGPDETLSTMTAASREMTRIFTSPDDWLQREMADLSQKPTADPKDAGVTGGA